MMIGLGENTFPDKIFKLTRSCHGYVGHFCDQLYKQFLLNIFKTIDNKAWIKSLTP